MSPAHNSLIERLARAVAGGPLAGVAGSDAHTLRRIGRTWTEAPGQDRGGVSGQPARRPGPARRAPRRRRRGRGRCLRRGRALLASVLGSGRAIIAAGIAPACAAFIAASRCRCSSCRAAIAPMRQSARAARRWRAAAADARRAGASPSRDRRCRRSRAMSAARSRSPGSGSSPRSARPARRVDEPARRHVRHRPVDRVRRPTATAAGSPRRSTYDRLAAAFTPLQRRRWSRGDQFGVVAADGGARRCGLCSTRALDPTRIGVLLGAGTADLLRTERYFETWITKGIDARGPRRSGITFSSTPVDVIAAHFGFEGLAVVHRRGVRVEHDGHRQRGGRDASRPARCGDRRRHRRPLAADLQRVQRAAA